MKLNLSVLSIALVALTSVVQLSAASFVAHDLGSVPTAPSWYDGGNDDRKSVFIDRSGWAVFAYWTTTGSSGTGTSTNRLLYRRNLADSASSWTDMGVPGTSAWDDPKVAINANGVVVMHAMLSGDVTEGVWVNSSGTTWTQIDTGTHGEHGNLTDDASPKIAGMTGSASDYSDIVPVVWTIGGTTANLVTDGYLGTLTSNSTVQEVAIAQGISSNGTYVVGAVYDIKASPEPEQKIVWRATLGNTSSKVSLTRAYVLSQASITLISGDKAEVEIKDINDSGKVLLAVDVDRSDSKINQVALLWDGTDGGGLTLLPVPASSSFNYVEGEVLTNDGNVYGTAQVTADGDSSNQPMRWNGTATELLSDLVNDATSLGSPEQELSDGSFVTNDGSTQFIPKPTVSLSVSETTIKEDASASPRSAVVTLSRTGTTRFPEYVTLTYAGEADANADVSGASTNVTIAQGDSSANFTISVVDDNYVENLELLSMAIDDTGGTYQKDSGAYLHSLVIQSEDSGLGVELTCSSITDGGSTSTATYSVTATFTESVSDFVVGDISLTNATVSNFAGSGSTYTFDVTASATGSVAVTIASGVATGGTSSALNSVSNTYDWVYDTTAPTVTLSSSFNGVTTANTMIPLNITFSESVQGFDAGDITVSNASLTNLTGAGAEYVVFMRPSGNGTFSAGLAASVVQDAAGNSNTKSNQIAATADNTIDPTYSYVSREISGPTEPSWYNQNSSGHRNEVVIAQSGWAAAAYYIKSSDGGTVSNRELFRRNIALAGSTWETVSLSSITSSAWNDLDLDINNDGVMVLGSVDKDGTGSIGLWYFNGSEWSQLEDDLVSIASDVSDQSPYTVAGASGTQSGYVGVMPKTYSPGSSTETDLNATYSLLTGQNVAAADALTPDGAHVVGGTYDVSSGPSFVELWMLTVGDTGSVKTTTPSAFNTLLGWTPTEMEPELNSFHSVGNLVGVPTVLINAEREENGNRVKRDSVVWNGTTLTLVDKPKAFSASEPGFMSNNGTVYATAIIDPQNTNNGHAYSWTSGGTAALLNENTSGTEIIYSVQNMLSNGELVANYGRNVLIPTPTVTVTAGSGITEDGTTSSDFIISRTGANYLDQVVSFTLSGTATVSSDYSATETTTVTIPAGSAAVSVTITAVDDSDVEGDESVTLTLAAGTYVRGSASSANIAITSDEPAVSVTMTASGVSDGGSSNVSAQTITAVFGESVTGFGDSDITITGGTLTSSVSGFGTTYTFGVTASSETEVSITIAASAVSPINGNKTFTWTYDITSPTSSLALVGITEGSKSNSTGVSLTATFSEAVTGFGSDDLTVTNGTVSSVSGSGTSYTVVVAPSGDGNVVVNVSAGGAADAASNTNGSSSTVTWEYDGTAPTVSAFTCAANGTSVNVAQQSVSVTFNEVVSTFSETALTLTNATINSGTISTSDSLTYTFTVTPAADGTVSIAVPANATTDTAGNGNAVYATALSWTYDSIKAEVSSLSTAVNGTSTNVAQQTVTLVFSEAVTGLTEGEITITGSAAVDASSLTTSDNITYTFTVTASSDGTVTVAVPADVAQDAAGNNNNTASANVSWTYDSTNPVISSFTATGASTTGSNVIPFSVVFDGAVSGLTEDDFTIVNGSVGSGSLASSDNITFTFTVTPSAAGTVSATLVAAKATDTAGNGNDVSVFTPSVTYDNTGPTVTVTRGESTDPTSVAQQTITLVFSESLAASSLAENEITVVNCAVDSGSLTTSDNTTFTFTVTASASGTVSVSVAADVAADGTDGTTNQNSSVLSWGYDGDGPVPTTTVQLMGTVTDSGTITMTIDGSPVTITAGAWTHNVVIGAGLASTTVTLVATDDSTNSVTRTITVSQPAPSLDVLQDLSGNN